MKLQKHTSQSIDPFRAVLVLPREVSSHCLVEEKKKEKKEKKQKVLGEAVSSSPVPNQCVLQSASVVKGSNQEVPTLTCVFPLPVCP